MNVVWCIVPTDDISEVHAIFDNEKEAMKQCEILNKRRQKIKYTAISWKLHHKAEEWRRW